MMMMITSPCKIESLSYSSREWGRGGGVRFPPEEWREQRNPEMNEREAKPAFPIVGSSLCLRTLRQTWCRQVRIRWEDGEVHILFWRGHRPCLYVYLPSYQFPLCGSPKWCCIRGSSLGFWVIQSNSNPLSSASLLNSGIFSPVLNNALEERILSASKTRFAETRCLKCHSAISFHLESPISRPFRPFPRLALQLVHFKFNARIHVRRFPSAHFW